MKYLIIVTLSMLTIHLAYSSTKKATITAHCYSFQLSPLDWKDGDITYFTTYDGTSGQPYNSNGIVSSEVKPTTIGSSAYRTDFLGIDAFGIYSYGTVSMSIPSTDSDNNGVPDFLQKEKSVNSSVNYNAVTHWDRYGDYEATPPATVLFTRSANSSSGTYQITHSDGVNVTSYNYIGTWHINSWTGEVTYDENKNITINVSSLTAEGATVNVTGTGQYNYISETLSLGGINLTDGADTIQTKNAELVRSGSTYSGQLSLKDGEVDTPWVDYANWKVFITDTNDHDSDGIPDLTDPPTPSASAETYVWENYDDFSGSSLNTEKWGAMYYGGGIQPYVSNGKLVLRGGFGNPTATKVVKAGWENILQEDDGGQAWVYAKDSDIYGIEAEFIIPTNAAQSSGLAVGVASLSPFSYAGAELNADPSSTSQYSQGFGFYHLPANGGEVERFKTGQRGVTHRLSVTLTDGVIKMYVDDELQYSSDAGNFNIDMFYVYAFNDHQESGIPFELNTDNVRVLKKATDTSTSPPSPVTLVSTPDGKPVVVKVGDVYKWNSALDGVSLWGVWEDEDNGWTAATIQYVDGKQKGNIGLNDQLTSDLIVDHPYVVDESGMIKVTEDTAYQYYQVTGVENGVIQTADDSVFPLSDTSWFFTTRAAAEEYYYSKAGYPKPKGWLWFDQYPWVYSDEEQGWLYFRPSGDKLHYWSYKYKTWQEYAPK